MGCCMEAAKGGIISPAPRVFISLTIHMVNHLQQLSTTFNHIQHPKIRGAIPPLGGQVG